MAKQKYEVIRPWHGVEMGEVLELDSLHPALKANVRAIRSTDQKGELTPAKPAAKGAAEKQ